MKIVTVKLQGGLGNQMFQIATTYAYAKEFNFIPKFDFTKCVTVHQGFSSIKYKDTLFKNLISFDCTTTNFINYFKETTHSFDEIPYYEDNLFLDGYFQSEKYFKNYKKELRELFSLDYTKILFFLDSLPQNKDMTSIHVRRGDYLKFPGIHDTCSLEYYKNAMDIIGDNNFIIVSDDIEWCKENIKGENIYYSPFTDEIDDLLLISSCKNKIIANSSFSWWGGYLSTVTSKVIAPKKWFGVSGPKEQSDIIPSNWIKI
tara:strand:+ start:3307 stop:4083 length:777 start_codon:yes stop_codon:yes gene_type:complete